MLFMMASRSTGTVKNAGIRLAVATSKPEKYARKVAEHLRSRHILSLSEGQMDGSRTKKGRSH